MFKRFASIIALSSLLVFIVPAAASAHVLRADHGITAELHIKPYDRPVVGQKTTYILYFEDEPDTFKLSDYTTRISIVDTMDPGKVISDTPLVQTKPGESENSYTFPMAMDYELTVTGTPKDTGTSQPGFKLTYPIHVGDDAAKKSTASPLLWAAICVGIVVIIAAAVVMERSGKHPQGPGAK